MRKERKVTLSYAGSVICVIRANKPIDKEKIVGSIKCWIQERTKFLNDYKDKKTKSAQAITALYERYKLILGLDNIKIAAPNVTMICLIGEKAEEIRATYIVNAAGKVVDYDIQLPRIKPFTKFDIYGQRHLCNVMDSLERIKIQIEQAGATGITEEIEERSANIREGKLIII